MKHKQIITLLLTATLLLVGACGKKKNDAKNMQQLQNEMGVPVRVDSVQTSTFEQTLSYNATLGGIEESTAQAMVSDVVLAINAKIGDQVRKGDIIVKFPMNTPAAQFEQATSAYNSISAVHDRMKRLYEKGAISLQDYENVQTQYKVSKANLESSEQMINVRAPISGIITNIMVDPAQKVFPGQNLFTVASTGGYKAQVMVPDSEISKVRKGAKVTATWENQTITGRVSTIALAMDQDSKAFKVEATFPGYKKTLNFGVTAAIGIEVLSKSNVIVVERQYLVTDNGNTYVWVSEGGKAVKRQVQTGLDNSLAFEIVSGLNPGDMLITEGINMLSDNSKIQVIE